MLNKNGIQDTKFLFNGTPEGKHRFPSNEQFLQSLLRRGKKKPVPLPSAGWTGRTTIAKKSAGLFSSFSKALSGNVYHEAIIYEAVRDSIISP